MVVRVVKLKQPWSIHSLADAIGASPRALLLDLEFRFGPLPAGVTENSTLDADLARGLLVYYEVCLEGT